MFFLLMLANSSFHIWITFTVKRFQNSRATNWMTSIDWICKWARRLIFNFKPFSICVFLDWAAGPFGSFVDSHRSTFIDFSYFIALVGSHSWNRTFLICLTLKIVRFRILCCKGRTFVKRNVLINIDDVVVPNTNSIFIDFGVAIDSQGFWLRISK